MDGPVEQIPLSGVESLISALDHAMRSDWPTERRIEYLLNELQRLLGRNVPCMIALVDFTHPGEQPRAIARYTIAMDLDDELHARYHSDEQLGAVYDILKPHVDESFSHPESVIAVLLSALLGAETWRNTRLFREYYEPMGYDDGIYTIWMTAHRRLIGSAIYHTPDEPPFTREDVQLASLVHRAMAPMIDREMFAEHPALAGEDLTERQREVLKLLLAGDSEKEIAAQLHRSVHTIHTYVKQLYEHFRVNSRGELMAKFIDRRAVS
jgi:DNA-binding CsgD family transcriptional regulator